jgi:hypothetical protein
MTVILSFLIGALAGAGTAYAFYRRLQKELARLKDAARLKVDAAL